MHRTSTILCAAAAAAGLLAVPASALAKGTVVAGPLKAKGYTITITATDAGSADSLGVTAVRRSGTSTQMHSWSFDKGVSVSLKGTSATIKGDLGRFGRIKTTISTTRKVAGRVPAGCKGTVGSVRTGTMTGTTKLSLDTTFFRTLSPSTLPAQIVKGGTLTCDGAGPGTTPKGTMLSTNVTSPEGQLFVSVTRTGAQVSQQVMRSDDAAATAPASVFHIITTTTGSTGLDVAADLSAATAPAAGPFLAGTLSFTGQPLGTMATGTIAGDFAARFDAIGTQAIPAGTDGLVMTY